MKKLAVLAIFVGIAAAVIASLIGLRGNAAKETPTAQLPTEVSPKSAGSLQVKIDDIEKAEEDSKRESHGARVEVFEAELESYVLYSLREEIPAKIDSIDVQLTPGTVAADTQITFKSDSAGNPIMDLFGGTHHLFVKGKLTGEHGRGKFDLQEVRVDGVPVPKVLIQTLFKKYVKPKYPEADLDEPFDLPWGIEDLKVETGKATVMY